MLARKLRILAAAPVLALVIQGCVNEEGTYNDFVSRQKALQEGGVEDGGPEADAAGPCTPPQPNDIDGEYLFALSAKVLGKVQAPVLFLADMKTVAYKGGTGLSLKLQSLSATDRKTVVGSPIVVPTIGIGGDGTIAPTPMPTLTISGKANPLQPGQDIVASNVALVGQMCGKQDFYCGTVTGDVSQPIPLKLDGSPYTFEAVTDPNKLPDPIVVDCAGDTAPPLP